MVGHPGLQALPRERCLDDNRLNRLTCDLDETAEWTAFDGDHSCLKLSDGPVPDSGIRRRDRCDVLW